MGRPLLELGTETCLTLQLECPSPHIAFSNSNFFSPLNYQGL